ncbi:sensor histidine kinase NtrY-like [Acidisoma cladoniae]|jgi:two-component system nitrogen regulation sensor histidine kinase NtrY|uniref:sensor histidine kinase NtrY-like n=1 Tax=Acidisoma cladoniae TaxID=3040935 RepID=UPI00254C06C8|nr:PAS domain-containing sensor histidine kinase [Acidisoma sp. PAMC 29798]
MLISNTPASMQLVGDQASSPRNRSPFRTLLNIALGKTVTLLLATLAAVLAVASFVILSGGTSLGLSHRAVLALVPANIVVLMLLMAAVSVRVVRVLVERRRGTAGSKLQAQLVLLFSVVAVTPAIVVAIFATVFFQLGIQAWFNERVRTALDESMQVAQGYLTEHKDEIRTDAFAMANDMARAGPFLTSDFSNFGRFLTTQITLRGLTEAVVFLPSTGQIIASAGFMPGVGGALPPPWAEAVARGGDVVVMGSQNGTVVSGLVQLDSTPPTMLLIQKPVDPAILAHMAHTEAAVTEYHRLESHRHSLQFTFVVIFAIVALLVLSAAILFGLVFANQIARPVGRLIRAAERIRSGDLAVRLPESRRDDEIAGLTRAFNRMTGQLDAQRSELMKAYSQIDERRRFTEAVLGGVSAGVIGLDGNCRIELPNRAASRLLGEDLIAAIGRPLDDVMPEFAALIETVRTMPDRPRRAEIAIGPPTQRRLLNVRLGAEMTDQRVDGFVITFDDITELAAAQRKAAWSDVARRIAHEIKNPLTPIQLSAERLKRRFLGEITSDPETFRQCADTIVRQVEDIGRMVDEFSAFARMPQPVIKEEDIGQVARDALMLQQHARPEIRFTADIPAGGLMVACDRRLIGQALTNLLQNAADAISTRPGAGEILLTVMQADGMARVSVADDGVGLPQAERTQLTEPYVTTKEKGTGLGLAIVKKVMEDHEGLLLLEDRQPGPGAVATLVLPLHSRSEVPVLRIARDDGC